MDASPVPATYFLQSLHNAVKMRSFFRLVIPAIHHQLYVFWLHFHGWDVGTEWRILVRYYTMNDHCAKSVEFRDTTRENWKKERLFFLNPTLKWKAKTCTNRYKSLTTLLHIFHFCLYQSSLTKRFRRNAEVCIHIDNSFRLISIFGIHHLKKDLKILDV